jgi:hypothetical protein
MAGSVTPAAQPDAARNARYTELLGLYRQLYPALRDVMAGLAAFKAKR